MAVIQNAYPATIPVGLPGQVANGETSNRISRTLEDATPLPFGSAVFFGAQDHGCTATPTAGNLYGFAIANIATVNLTFGAQTGADVYNPLASVGIMTLGAIFVTSATAAAKGAQVYVTSAGAITNASAGNVICPGWFFDNTITVAGIVRIARR